MLFVTGDAENTLKTGICNLFPYLSANIHAETHIILHITLSTNLAYRDILFLFLKPLYKNIFLKKIYTYIFFKPLRWAGQRGEMFNKTVSLELLRLNNAFDPHWLRHYFRFCATAMHIKSPYLFVYW